MKKIGSLLLVIVMGLTLLAGCGSDPVLEDFENYLNVEMVDVNANYEKITAEVGNWSNLESDEQLLTSLKDKLLPLVEDSIKKLAGIEPATEEVKAIKAKYQKVMEAYKEGFEGMAACVESGDETNLGAATAKLEEGIGYLEEYNAALEALAAEKGYEIEY